jgi:hypothetical protein
MAVVSASGRTVPLYVLIIFIVLFLLATTGLVLLFVNQETLRQDAEQATTTFDDYVGTVNKSKLESFKALGKQSKPSLTAVGALLQDRAALAQMMSGNASATAKEVTDKLNTLIDSLKDPATAKIKKTAQTDFAGAFALAIETAKNKSTEAASLAQELADCQKSKDTVVAGYAELENKFNTNIAKITEQLKALDTLLASYKEEITTQISENAKQVSSEQTVLMNKMGKKTQASIDEIRDLVRRNLQVLIKSSAELGSAQQRARIDMTAEQLIQKVDGQVLDMTGPVVYIDLGKQQGIKTGVRFVVADVSQKGQFQPAIKAVVEVTSVGDLTSEAHVVASIPGNPIVQGDILYNVIFNREMPLSFFVMGEFDLTGDGAIDLNGPQRVGEIITLAGGVVAKQISPAVNFVIVGQAPAAPEKPSSESEFAQKEYEKKMKNIQKFNDEKDQLQALSIPTISEKDFVKYTGYLTDLGK